MHSEGSRYETVATASTTEPGGRVVRYRLIRTIPDPPAGTGYTMTAGERLDHVAHRFLGDPEQFWRICDANRAMWPPSLAEPTGRPILIPEAEV